MRIKQRLTFFGKFCLGLTICGLIFVPTAIQAASKPINWVLSTPFGSESYGGKGTAWIIERIKKNSNGQLLIEPYYAGSLGYKSPEYLKVFKDGLMDMAELSPPHAMGTEPLFGACILPFTFFSYDDYYDFTHKVLIPKLSAIVEQKWNIKIIGNLMYAQTAFYGQKAITKVDDFKGIKVRVMSPLGRDIYRKLGAQPTYIPFEELYTALQRGVVQAMPNSLTAAADVKVWEVCSNASLIGYVIGTGFMVVNKKSFDSLPKELQEIVLEAGAAYSKNMKDEINRMGNAALMQYLDHGMTLTKMPQPVMKNLRTAAHDVWVSWTKKVGPEAEEILKAGGLLAK